MSLNRSRVAFFGFLLCALSLSSYADCNWTFPTGTSTGYTTCTVLGVGPTFATTTPGAPLHVSAVGGMISMFTGTGNSYARVNNTTSTHPYIDLIAGNNSRTGTPFGEIRVGDDLTYRDLQLARLAGNIGIGLGTDDDHNTPQAQLHLRKSAPAAIGPEIRLENSGNAVGDMSAITFADNYVTRAQIRSTVENTPWKGTLEFFTGYNTLVEAMHITGDGKVGIGTKTPVSELHVIATSASGTRGATVDQVSDDGSAPLVSTRKARGTTAAPTAVQTNDAVGRFYPSGYDGASYVNGANIRFVVDGTVATNSIPTAIQFYSGSTGGGAEQMRLASSGNVGIGNPSPNYKLDVTGAIHATGAITSDSGIHAVYQDLAEWVPATQQMPAGTVVVLNRNNTNEVTPSMHAYDTAVAGVVSVRPGIILGVAADTKASVATTGRVRVRVDATKHPIAVGDILVTSEKEGMAMVSEPVDLGGIKIHRPGTIVGKALEPLAAGEGEILVLLSLQ